MYQHLQYEISFNKLFIKYVLIVTLFELVDVNSFQLETFGLG
jgi:hypothetical protein